MTDMRKCRNWQTSKTKDLVLIASVWVQVPSSALEKEKREPFIREVSSFLLYRKFLKSSEIVYNRLEIKNDITKERRGLRHDVVYEVFCFGLG